jgi:hypothetical protein
MLVEIEADAVIDDLGRGATVDATKR